MQVHVRESSTLTLTLTLMDPLDVVSLPNYDPQIMIDSCCRVIVDTHGGVVGTISLALQLIVCAHHNIILNTTFPFSCVFLTEREPCSKKQSNTFGGSIIWVSVSVC